MLKEAIHHENFGTYAYPKTENELNLRLRTARDDISECYVYYIERYDYTPGLLCKKMERFAYDEYYDYFHCTIKVESKRFKYFFKLVDIRGEQFFYLENGFKRDFPENTLNGGYFQYPYINCDDILDIPLWCKNVIFYEIFPERFCNGDRNNDPMKVQQWGTKPYRDSFFGGDIKGIISKLDYLQNLGVNAIYLTPVFLSNSNHKYDTIDYYKIDPNFGSLEDMKELVREAHNKGIRVVLDVVFNHCSNKNKIFTDVVKNGKDSPYADWFYIKEFPVKMKPVPNYETFGVNIYSMPRLNTSNPKVREYLIGVAEYWTRELDIDGWRLDVADEVSHGFWKEFRKRLKSIKKDIFIIGEVWYCSTPWLMGDEFDSVMNYPFRQAVIDFFVKRQVNRDGFIIKLNRYFLSYKDETLYYLLNLLGSHDTARFLTLCGGNIEKMRLSVIFTMTFVGIPMIYYGDEIGMEGGDDPDCRKTMIWDREVPEPALFNLYKRLIRIRKDYQVLVNGSIKFIELSKNKGVLSFIRDNGSEKAMVIINNSDSTVKVEIKKAYFNKTEVTDQLHNRKYRFNTRESEEIVSIKINKMEAVLLT